VVSRSSWALVYRVFVLLGLFLFIWLALLVFIAFRLLLLFLKNKKEDFEF